MSFICPLCGEEWIFSTRLCDDCSKIRRFMNLYGKKKVCDVVDNVLLVNDEKIEVKTKRQSVRLLLKDNRLINDNKLEREF